MKKITFTLVLFGMLTSAYSQSDIPDFITDIDSIKLEKRNSNDNKWDEWFMVQSGHLYGGGLLYGLVTGDEMVEENTSPTGSIGFNQHWFRC